MRVETNYTTMHQRLLTAVSEARSLLTALQPLLAEPDGSGPDTGTIGRHAPESREPWAMQAAGAYWDLYFGAGELARGMRSAAGLRLPLFKDTYGHEALSVVVNMAPSVSDTPLRWAATSLEKWSRAAQSVPEIDEGEPWAPLPSPPGRSPLACPYCETFGLRMLRRKGEVRCFFPGCKDRDGHPTRARMEPGRMTGEERLIFGDGTTMGGGADE
jgi:hypothetical protein